jgi:cell division protease FtsH
VVHECTADGGKMNNQSPNNGNNNSNNKKNTNGQMILLFLLITLVALFFMSMFSRWQTQMTTKEISYTEFLKMVEEDKVDKVHVTSNSYRITPKKEKNELVAITYYTGIAGNDLELVSLLKEHGVEYYPYIPDDSATWIYNILSIVLPILLLWAVMGFLMRKMGSGMGMGVGKSTAKVYVEKKTGVTFRDVAGQDEAKESLQEVVDFLHNPQKYTDIGAKLPKGALLVGPPGTGKTLLAKAVAGEANVPFFSLAGSDFVEMFVGVGASRVRDLFKEAQKQAPCIIFIDEIDAIGKSRDTRYGSGNDEREQTLNQLLAEMDGFDTSKGLLILAATNRPEVLDKALLRPGRFDRRIIVEKPDLKGRVETLKVHSKDVLMDETVDLDAIALATSGAVGSDLANMINEAAINAVKNGRKYVNQSDLFESVEVVIAGKEKKDRILGKEEKRIVAYHEVGHALTTALQKNAEPVQKITIVPRTMGALGYVMQVPEEEKYLMSEEELKARLVTFMAGRAAEEIVFHSITTGASNDIEKATQIARAMVTQYGMSKKFGLISLESVENRYLDGRPVLNCGDDTAAEIDQEVQIILKDSYETAKKLLEENRDVLDRIADYLFEHETITGKEFMRIYREIKGIPQPPDEEEKPPVQMQGFRQASQPGAGANPGAGQGLYVGTDADSRNPGRQNAGPNGQNYRMPNMQNPVNQDYMMPNGQNQTMPSGHNPMSPNQTMPNMQHPSGQNQGMLNGQNPISRNHTMPIMQNASGQNQAMPNMQIQQNMAVDQNAFMQVPGNGQHVGMGRNMQEAPAGSGLSVPHSQEEHEAGSGSSAQHLHEDGQRSSQEDQQRKQ